MTVINKLAVSFLITLVLLLGSLGGYWFCNMQHPVFESLSTEDMYQTIISQRDYAIKQAVKDGKYHCCINPPCTMCYMEANEWNNHQAGTCACDELIAQGKEPCPQCRQGLINDTGVSCEIASQECDSS